MAETTLTLGGREFKVRTLKLGQMRGFLGALDELQDKKGADSIDAAAKLLVLGLPEEGLTENDILDLDASLDELNLAVAFIIREAGRLKAAEPGEVAPQPGA